MAWCFSTFWHPIAAMDMDRNREDVELRDEISGTTKGSKT